MQLRSTPLAEQALAKAQEVASSFNHLCIGSEHIMLGLIQVGNCVASRALQRLGIDVAWLRSAIEDFAPRYSRPVPLGPKPMTQRAARALDQSQKQAIDLRHESLGTAHLLLGLCLDKNSVPGYVLFKAGVDFLDLRVAVCEELVEAGDDDPDA